MTIALKSIPGRGVLFVMLALLAGNAYAQRGNFSPEQMRARFEEQNKEMVKELALSEEQTPKFMEIVNAALDKRMEMIAEMRTGGGDRGAIRDKITALDEETTEKLSDVLTEEQLTKYKELLAGRQRGPRRRQG